MNQTAKQLGIVEVDKLDDYPISVNERLESHFFVEFHYRRWLNSRFCMLADPEVMAYGFNLFFIAQDQAPVGTLPVDDLLLAKYLKIDVERWRNLCKHDISPLYNWRKVRCDNGEIRWAHPVVTEMAIKALSSRRKHIEANARSRERKRLHDLKLMIERVGAKQVLGNAGYLEKLDAWITKHYPDRYRTEPTIRTAMAEMATEDEL